MKSYLHLWLLWLRKSPWFSFQNYRALTMVCDSMTQSFLWLRPYYIIFKKHSVNLRKKSHSFDTYYGLLYGFS